MPRTNPAQWKSLAELGLWIERNCTNCRYIKEKLPGEQSNCKCPIPSLALTQTLHDQPIPKAMIGIVFHPKLHSHPELIEYAPYKCHTRLDNRGRPAAKPTP